MNIVFLDFNGVIITRDYDFRTGKYFSKFNTEAVKNINEFLEKTKSVIVISSTWRTNKSEYEIRNILKNHGLTGNVLSTTPKLVRKNRGQEIEAWLMKNRRKYKVNNIVIFDDKVITGKLAKYHVHVNRNFGITEEDTRKAQQLMESSKLVAI